MRRVMLTTLAVALVLAVLLGGWLCHLSRQTPPQTELQRIEP
jgi:hypothetical protein